MWADRKAPNAGVPLGWIVLAWTCFQNGVDHFETLHHMKTNTETGLAAKFAVVRIDRDPVSQTKS